MRLFLLCLLFTAILKTGYTQDLIAKQMNWYGQAKSSSKLFIHFDKNTYANNETVWFTGYFLKQSPITFNKHQVLAVSLIRDVDSAIVIQNKFLIQGDIVFGSLVIPDSLLTGDYHLMAHTDLLVNGKPDALFLQAITIKTNIEPSFKASMKIIKAANLLENTNQILLSVTSKEGSFLPKPTAVTYKYGNSLKNAKTDASGQLLINLPPQNNLTDPNLYVKLKYLKDSSFINLPLAPLKQRASVKFYPEGGNIVDGLVTTIGWEVKDQQQMPLAVYAFLYKDKEVIDTIETNSYGIGKFKMVPQNGSIYTVRLQHTGLIDSIYQLPAILNKGLVINMSNAIVGDTLQFMLKTNDARKLSIRIHNFRESYVHFPFDMEYHRRSVKVPLNEIPKGLTAITITDSIGKPLAERIFFAHYSNEEKITLKTDQSSYKQREKVTLKLNIPSHQEQAMVSIACIQDNRMQLKKMTDIESFTYINDELASIPTHFKGRAISEKEYLEQVLLIKGWRRYNWTEVNQINEVDTILKIDSLRLSGQIRRTGKEISKAVAISTLGTRALNLIETSNTGRFTLTNEQLLTSSNKPVMLFVNNATRSDYEFKINDTYLDFANDIKTKVTFERILSPSIHLNNAELVLKNEEKSTRLKEVTIIAKKDNSFRAGIGMPGRNACGDYVCSYNILNCNNHMGDSGNTQPIPGRTYMTNGMPQVYLECKTADNETEKFGKINGIHLHKEFYVDDYKEPQEPAFFSTIYWNYATLLNANKETELSFYTSDITGRFRIVVQGVTNKDVIYAEQFFEVKK